ncbi:biotin--[acetyl-CoA-carboxylase] ligase [Microvirga sp. W0021]|uniref:Biotin--[acetyl-CoA-carboxylase] ligase n=1 Tax=Hohaiivirga grylli TaxID=3133970 RepID=A0ABV0BL06_9HYPH
MKIIRHQVIDSTNREAARLIATGQSGDSVIVSERQTAGQGRYDRRWESRSNLGLLFSAIRTVKINLENLPQATLVAAVAVADGIEATTGLAPKVKWPNDLLINGRKICGILVENPVGYSNNRDDVHTLVFGVGINVSQQTTDFSSELTDRATSLAIALEGKEIDKVLLLEAVVQKLDEWLAVWSTQGFTSIRDAWLSRNCTIGQRILLSDAATAEYGEAIGLTPDGGLSIRFDSGIVQNVDAGEISFARQDDLSAPLR